MYRIHRTYRSNRTLTVGSLNINYLYVVFKYGAALKKSSFFFLEIQPAATAETAGGMRRLPAINDSPATYSNEVTVTYFTRSSDFV